MCKLVAAVCLAVTVSAASADTFTHRSTGQVLKGKLLGTVAKGGKTLLMVKTSAGDLRYLPELEWAADVERKPKPKPYEWPKLEYKGKVRDPRWLNKMYAYFKTRLLIVEGQAVDMDHAYGDFYYLTQGDYGKDAVHVKRILADDEMLLEARNWRYRGASLQYSAKVIHVKGIPTKGLVDGQRWEGELVCVGTYRSGGATMHSFRPPPKTRPELTPEQFADVLRSGFELIKWVWMKDGKLRDYHGRPKRYQRRVPVE